MGLAINEPTGIVFTTSAAAQVAVVLHTESAVSSSSPDDSRHPWHSRYAPPSAFAFAILQTPSGFRRNDDDWSASPLNAHRMLFMEFPE
jgi:hypothetical protein